MQRSILISGCSSGIGLTTARVLRGRGWRVFATARQSKDVSALVAEGFEATLLDLTDDDSIAGAMEWTLGRTGGTLEALFNNGAYGQPGAMEDLSREALRQQFETNVFGTHVLTRLAIGVMRRQGGGRIIQNSSILGFVALPYRGAYVASKFALEGMTGAMRLETRGSGIHFIIIQPGPINTPFRANARLAFLRHVNLGGSCHAKNYDHWSGEDEQEGSSGGRFSLPPEAVTAKVIHALESSRPRLRYGVTVPTHVFSVFRRLLSQRMLDRLLVHV